MPWSRRAGLVPQLRAAGMIGRFLEDDSGRGKGILPPEKPF